MNKREVTEIKRRFKKESCTFSRMAGCYVDSSKEKVTTFAETFLNLDDDEFHKYLELASKCLSGVIGNNLLELPYDTEEMIEGGASDLLLKLRDSKLKDDDLLNVFYDRVIDTYDYAGNYLIVLYHDVYDIPMKTSDDILLDDSEETYEYIICAICPVQLSKPALGYREDENRIGARKRDWIVSPTDTGFTYPCFTDRSTDIHNVFVYTKSAKEPHNEFFENGLSVKTKRTNQQKRTAFNSMITKALGDDSEEAKDIAIDVQQNLSEYIFFEKERRNEDEPILLEAEQVAEILSESGVSEVKAGRITADFKEYFQEELPEAEEILDEKLLKNNELRIEKNQLKEKVVDLTNQLKEVGILGSDGKKPADIVVKVSEDKADEVVATFVNGVRCLVVPIEPTDYVTVNGKNVE